MSTRPNSNYLPKFSKGQFKFVILLNEAFFGELMAKNISNKLTIYLVLNNGDDTFYPSIYPI